MSEYNLVMNTTGYVNKGGVWGLPSILLICNDIQKYNCVHNAVHLYMHSRWNVNHMTSPILAYYCYSSLYSSLGQHLVWCASPSTLGRKVWRHSCNVFVQSG